MSIPHFGAVTIIGVGLLGGSLGLALKERGIAAHVRGVGRRRSSLDTALEVAAIDEAFLDAREAVPGSDLIIICTPAGLTIETMDMILPVLSEGCVVTDVASTKSEICAHARKTWPAPFRFIGSHPMAGSEKFGPEHAVSSLFEGCVTMVQRSGDIDAAAREKVRGLWLGVGARVVDMEPEAHDAIAARTSHVPHILASALAALGAVDIESRADDIRSLIGNGFRDTTRIAASRAETWRDICLTNREAVLAGLDDVLASLGRVRDKIAAGDAAGVDAFFEKGREAREMLARDGDCSGGGES
jgi:prephenate dehydrogenase